ncbi:MAG TPA: extracellular solute-binding protein [Chloroflexota bacterium]|nr:extracellular solute-binding protein [Chloroflexota bacterium]
MRRGTVSGLVVLLTLAACTAPARPPAAPPAAAAAEPSAPAGTLEAVIAAARQEGELTILAPLAGSSESVPRWGEGANRAYGLNLDVRYTPAPAMPELMNRLIQEQQSGRPASTDVFIGSSEHVVPMMRANALEAVDWAAWAPNVQDPRLVAPQGVAVQLAARAPGITYNLNRVRDVPTSLADLLQPQYKGRIASTPYAAHFDKLSSPELWGEERTKEYVTRLAQQIAGVLRCSELDRIASGEYDLFAIDCGAEWRSAAAKGAPLGHVIPADAALLVYWYVGVPKNAPHPNAAKLFINYMLGREGQDILFDTELVDHPLVAGSKSASEIEALQARGVRPTEADVAFYQRNDDKLLEQTAAELQRILQKQQ